MPLRGHLGLGDAGGGDLGELVGGDGQHLVGLARRAAAYTPNRPVSAYPLVNEYTE